MDSPLLMVGFRNVLVHDYAAINLKLVYEFLHTKEAIALLRQAVERLSVSKGGEA